MSRILIADDQNDVLEALRILLKGEGHQTDAVTSLAGIFQALRKGRRLEAANQLLRGNAPNIIAESPRMRPVLEIISRVAPSDANVLITGEYGTGKGLVARAIHALSSRASHTMITVNMDGLSEGIFESELFGHVKGAFTDAKTDRAGRFELADESTLFMDEIANVPMNQQAKLLRVIETGEL